MVTGYGTIDGRPVCVFSQDFTVFGGSLGEVFGEKIVKVMDHALKIGCPVIGINDCGGARIQEGVVALGLYAEIFYRNVIASGVIPQISLIMGPCAGGAVYSPAITDFTLMVEGTSHMFITGPDVIKTVTGEEVSFEDLGGAHAHNAKSGVAHYQAEDEDDCLDFARELLSYLPSNNLDEPPVPRRPDDPARLEITEADAELDTLIPDSPNQPYDMHDGDRAASWTTGSSSRSTRGSRRTSWWASAGSSGAPRGRGGQPADALRRGRWTSTPRRRRRGSSGPATRSTSRC